MRIVTHGGSSLCVAMLPLVIGLSITEGVIGATHRQAAAVKSNQRPVWDENGYILFCLCMGRMGNQIAHFLGGLAVAKAINRTLVLPPFRTYKNIPFDHWYDASAIAEYHRVILADDFLQQFGGTKWPQEKRTALCFAFPSKEEQPCRIEGNPFVNFWQELGITFDKFENFYLPFSVRTEKDSAQWLERFPPGEYPLLALRGSPSSFPIAPEHISLHRYLRWSKAVAGERDSLIARDLPRPFVAIHIRNAPDFDTACQGLDNFGSRFMASPQCLGYNGEHGKLSRDLCYPPGKEIVRRAARAVRKLRAASLFVATADKPMLKELQAAVGDTVKVVHLGAAPHMEMAILAQADHFIGNCVSSFTAAVRQERDTSGRLSEFFSFPSLLSTEEESHGGEL